MGSGPTLNIPRGHRKERIHKTRAEVTECLNSLLMVEEKHNGSGEVIDRKAMVIKKEGSCGHGMAMGESLLLLASFSL